MDLDLWTATDGGALLAAAVLLPFIGMLLGLVLGGRWLRGGVVVGPLVFIAVGLLGAWTAGAFLGYPDGFAKPMIVAIEVALLPTLVLVLALLMNGPPSRGGGR